MKSPAFRPYARFGMSRDACTLLDAVRWLARMREMECSPDHPDFDPEHPRSIARAVRETAAKLIGATAAPGSAR
jgi:hypothetical protein